MRNRECVKKVAERKGYSYKEFPNYVQHSSKKIFWFFYDSGSWISIRLGNENQVLAKLTGKWECDESNNYKVVMAENFYLSKTNKWLPNPQSESSPQPVGDNSVFDCILKNKNLQGDVAKVDPTGNFASFMVDEPNKVSHIFYKDKKWIQSKDGVTQFSGKWNCDGDHHFTIISDDNKLYSTRSNNWTKISQDTFPLKYGSNGPNVVKLQKFLNSKLPSNPLTINGIFDTETENKLIQYQKQEGLI